MTKYTQTEYSLSSSDLSGGQSRNRYYPTREGDIRARLFEMMQSNHNISQSYRDNLRAMIAAFNDLGIIDDEGAFISTKCITGNAERAIAYINKENNIILPILSITQTTTRNSNARQRYENVLVNESYWDEDKGRAIRVLSLAPRPVDIVYQVNIWSKYLNDLDQLSEQIRMKFNPSMSVATPFSTLAKATIDMENDMGSKMGGDKQDRVLRRAFDIVLETYIPSPKFRVTSTGEIEEFKIEADVI